ncbi:MAG: aminotransferase class V-fold PLP-dependent enzyme [Candidatus Levyibacteriota bacterium]|nr:MAG: aminotransferase class V-fold PLP-dependent enzyme [Candidatus Levybacteria bacterium]
MKRPIAIGLSPNLEGKDILFAFRLLCMPTRWLRGNGEKRLEAWFNTFFAPFSTISFVSGRGALFAVLKAFDIKAGDEVILQAFTCSVVPNAILACGATPIYADITDSLTFDSKRIEQKISKKTKAIIVQHTFGIPSDMEVICSIAKQHKLFVIEDCAHVIGGELKGQKLGTFGDAAIFSFGRDKAFSSVFGGVAITKEKDVVKRLQQIQQLQAYPSVFWLLQQLLHPIAAGIVLPLYDFFGIGKLLLVLFQKLKLLSFPIKSEEKKGKMSIFFVKKMPNALAELALFQLSRLSEFNKKRAEAASSYLEAFGVQNKIIEQQKMPLLRFPLFVQNRDKLLFLAKKQHIYLGAWYSEIIDPKGVFLEKVYYKRGSCPKAENIAERIINLPTYPTLSKGERERVINFMKVYVRNS